MSHLALEGLPRWQGFRLEMNRAMEINGVYPVTDRVIPFAEAGDAYRYLESGAISARFALRCETGTARKIE